MVKHRRYKGAAGYMADIAILRCWNVAGMLANRTTSAAIMTGLAPFTHNVGSAMIDKCTEEISRVMAGSAIFISALVNRRIRRTSGTNSSVVCTSIMARSAVTSDARVSNISDWCECSNSVTVVTILNRR